MEKNKKNLKDYVLCTLTMILFTVVFSLTGLIFLAIEHTWVHITVGLLFMVPTVLICYLQGKSRGELVYRQNSKNTLADIHRQQPTKIPYHRCAFYLAGYFGFYLLFILVTVISRNHIMQLITSMLMFQPALFFYGVGFYNMAVVVSWKLIVVFLPYILLNCGGFAFGFFRNIQKLRRQQSDIEGEIRMFNN